MIKNIIFDLGGVILTHKRTLTKDVISSMFPEIKEKVHSLYNSQKRLLQTGKITSLDFFTSLKKELHLNETPEELREIWISEYKKVAHIDHDMLSLIDSLGRHYDVYLLTDTSDEHDKYNSTRNIYSHFKRIFKSHEEGLMKPDLKAFENILQKISAKANECIFIDDFEENVKAAESLGMKGIVYKNLGQLETYLDKMRVEI